MGKVLKSKNPVIQKAREEGYNQGYEAGFKLGNENGQYVTANFIKQRFDGLDKVPGIGPKIFEKIVKHFGEEYFKKI
jgi:hypothetical protein